MRGSDEGENGAGVKVMGVRMVLVRGEGLEVAPLADSCIVGVWCYSSVWGLGGGAYVGRH